MIEPKITKELAIQHGLTEEEYKKILEILGRTPTYTELGIYSVMWSEHCSYKNSIALLKTLPRTGERVLVGAGEENAGLVDIGDGLAVAFKIESHNHPSAVEPYQGAATGVGGIMRDIFTMGARPIASLNSLRFGELTDPHSRQLFRNVVKGIGDYGNSFGVPTVAGEIYFDNCYQGNPIVNAMAVGIVRHEEIASATAKGAGNPVMIVGSATGKDGIHGATFASEEISEKSESKRPSVQVGDPFTEKLLLEATLEVIGAGYLVGVQDMGAAGITCSTTEMSAKGKSGMKIDLDLVPVREKDMSAYEIMLSESQERMLLVVKRGCVEKVKEIFERWDLHSVVIGEVTDTGFVSVTKARELVAEVPAESLVLGGGAPVYLRGSKEPERIKIKKEDDFSNLPQIDLAVALKTLLASPNIASKKWAYRQYDSMVRTGTRVGPGSDAAVVRVPGTDKYLAMKTDCNARYVYLNPKIGAEIAVAEAARNVVCSGATPIGMTNCLNFGNPYKPESYWEFKEAIVGISIACNALGIPVTGGNVSFYNENPKGSIFPTPVIGVVGLIQSSVGIVTSEFKDAGEDVYLLGKARGDINGSEYLKLLHKKIGNEAPFFDIQEEKKLQECCLKLIENKLISSAHDISDGGIAVAIAESCFVSESTYIGCEMNVNRPEKLRDDFFLFGEEQNRIVISASPRNKEEILKAAMANDVALEIIGRTIAAPTLMLNGNEILALEEGVDLYNNSIAELMR
ncbi:MAG TPA: phosphoribosylformylglycinamidine synthase subunit PurL [Bacteroidota bacterium]|nr:phosphoribosylformylglycinamidine synthase subunit PurL [Bacteroidota bacterium]